MSVYENEEKILRSLLDKSLDNFIIELEKMNNESEPRVGKLEYNLLRYGSVDQIRYFIENYNFDLDIDFRTIEMIIGLDDKEKFNLIVDILFSQKQRNIQKVLISLLTHKDDYYLQEFLVKFHKQKNNLFNKKTQMIINRMVLNNFNSIEINYQKLFELMNKDLDDYFFDSYLLREITCSDVWYNNYIKLIKSYLINQLQKFLQFYFF